MTPRQIQHSCGSFVANGCSCEKGGGSAKSSIFCNCMNIKSQRSGYYGTGLHEGRRLLHPGFDFGGPAGQDPGTVWPDASEILGGTSPRHLCAVLSGKLWAHLVDIVTTCEERMDTLIPAMAKQEGVTEALKAADQMAWVSHMNNIRNRAEEIILNELIYAL